MAELDEKELEDLLEDTLGEFSDEVAAHPGSPAHAVRSVPRRSAQRRVSCSRWQGCRRAFIGASACVSMLSGNGAVVRWHAG